jgi:hypothetical protein
METNERFVTELTENEQSGIKLLPMLERASRYRILNLDDLRARPASRSLIDGLLMLDSVAVLYGRYGTYKSFVAIDFALSVASGRDYFGRPVIGGPVVYVAAEGIGGVTKRADAWSFVHGPSGDCGFVELPVQLLDPDSVGEFLDAIGELPEPPKLIVFDTYARCLVGGDEASSRDAGLAVEQLERVRRATGACVLVVHHAGWNDDHMRGSSALGGGVTTIIKAKAYRDGRVELISEKQKDGEQFTTIRLRPTIVELPAGESSVVMLPDDAPDVDHRPRRQTNDAVLLRILRGLGEQGMTVGQWKQAAIDHGMSESTFKRTKKALVEDGRVVEESSGKSVVCRPADAGGDSLTDLSPDCRV